MKKVLVVCYYFPPLGLGGVSRPLHLYKLLAPFGYECHVLTVKPVTYRKYEPELLDGLDTSRIHRSGSRDPQRLLYLLGVRTLKHETIRRGKPVTDRYFPDSKVGWAGAAVRKGLRVFRQHRFDAIVSTSPPITSHVVGMRLAEDTGAPWVADFRDFWTMYKVEESFSSPEFMERGNSLLNDIRAKASGITVVNPAIREYVRTGNVITNGFDPELADLWAVPKDRTRFVIGIPGNLNEERVIEPILKVIRAVERQGLPDEPQIELLQLGQVDRPWLEAILSRYDMADRCHIAGFQQRTQAIPILSRCALFYLGLTADREQGIVPQRLFDLFASGRPILAYTDSQSEIASLLSATNSGLQFSDDTTPEAVAFLRSKVEAFASGQLDITLRPNWSQEYSATRMAERFAAVLDEVT